MKTKITIRRREPQQRLKVLDLFCGCGGMSKGFVDAGYEIIAGIDHWDKAIESYSKNFSHQAICADLQKLSPEEFAGSQGQSDLDLDVIVGGPPCQGFSIAGKRDQKDPRNSLFMEYVKYLDYFKPKAFIMENVVGILSMKNAAGQKVIDLITAELTRNYNIVVSKLYASDFGVPQNRRRVIIIGLRKDLNRVPTELAPQLSERVPVKTVLLPKDQVSQTYFLSGRAISGINRKREESKKKGNGFGAQFLDLDRPSFTIPARYWKDGYDALVKYSDTEIRRLTILELKRIQSFPDDYYLSGSNREQIMQIGNAVACKFAFAVANHLRGFLL